MSKPAGSYTRVFYDLRPAKQVERRMILDTFQAMSEAGFAIRDYQYTGMGSIYFVDFLLFHRLLGIKRMLSVENDYRIEKRVRFNKPFADVTIEMASVGRVIPTLSKDLRHILWLDYDFQLRRDALEDVVLASQTLPAGSVLIVTFDVEPPPGDGAADWKVYFEGEAENYVPFDATVSSFARSELGFTIGSTVVNAIKQGLAGRPEMRYLPMFSFLYADGHQMLTVGGVLGGATEEGCVGALKTRNLEFLRLDAGARPFEIQVPRITRKERLLLDQHMPCAPGWRPEEFELSSEEVASYRSVYRYYPVYGELLL